MVMLDKQQKEVEEDLPKQRTCFRFMAAAVLTTTTILFCSKVQARWRLEIKKSLGLEAFECY